MEPHEWGNLAVSVAAVAVSAWVAWRNYRRTQASERKETIDQKVADKLDQKNIIASGYQQLYQEYQEDRKEAKAEIERLQKEVKNLSQRISDMQKSHEESIAGMQRAHEESVADMRKGHEAALLEVRQTIPGYRGFIHDLRAQLYAAGIEPIKWPRDLEQ